MHCVLLILGFSDWHRLLFSVRSIARVSSLTAPSPQQQFLPNRIREACSCLLVYRPVLSFLVFDLSSIFRILERAAIPSFLPVPAFDFVLSFPTLWTLWTLRSCLPSGYAHLDIAKLSRPARFDLFSSSLLFFSLWCISIFCFLCFLLPSPSLPDSIFVDCCHRSYIVAHCCFCFVSASRLVRYDCDSVLSLIWPFDIFWSLILNLRHLTTSHLHLCPTPWPRIYLLTIALSTNHNRRTQL